MKFKELLNLKSGSDIRVIDKISNFGIINFGKGNTDKNEDKTPHYNFNKCMMAYEDISIVSSAVNELSSFIFPNKNITIASKDEKTQVFLEKWHSQRPSITYELMKNLITNLITGYAPLEKYYSKMADGKNVLDNVFSMNNCVSLYINPDDVDGTTAYIFEVPVGTKRFSYMGIEQTPQFWMVKYIKNYLFTFHRVYGITIPAWKIETYNSGWSRDNIYGRSQLASAIDACNIFTDIMSSWDTIAKTRQIDQKIITLDTTADSMLDIDDETIDKLQKKLEASSGSYTILGLPLKFLQTDISSSQGFNTLEGVFDLTRRQIMMSLIPQHLTPWSDSATTQGSEAAMPPFMARIKSKQNEVIHFWNHAIIDELRKTYPFIAEDATFVLDEPKIMDDSYYINKLTSLMQAGIVTADEAKAYMLKLGMLDEDLFDDKEEKPAPIMIPEVDSMTEALTAEDMGFNTFKKLLTLRYGNDKFDTKNWKQLKQTNVGGHNIRLIKADKTFLLFDGTNITDTYHSEVIDEKKAKELYNKFIDDVKKSFDEEPEEAVNDEDKIWNDLQNQLEIEYKKRLGLLFSKLDKTSRKSEKFLSSTIFDKLSNIFSDFNSFINKTVDGAMKKLDVIVKKDTEDDVKVDVATKKKLTDKRRLMSQALKDQLKTTKDSQLSTIKTKLSQGIAGGQDVKDIKSSIEKEFDYDNGVRSKIDRIIQTQGRNSSRLLKLKKWQAAGFTKAKVITRHDKKVRDKHKSMHNKIFTIKQLINWLSTNTYPGTSFNCRCIDVVWE